MSDPDRSTINMKYQETFKDFNMSDFAPHPMYQDWVKPDTDPAKVEKVILDDGDGSATKFPIRYLSTKPLDKDGVPRDQTQDAADHMRYAHSLNLPQLEKRLLPRLGRAIIVGGAPSIKDYLEDIRKLASDPRNCVFAVNWSHTWLIENGIIPNATVFFEIDAEPDTVLKKAHPDVIYYICSHCHPHTFDSLRDHKRVVWHTPPNSDIERQVGQEIFPNSYLVGGGIGTFTRTMTVALYLGYRHLDMFGCDSSFPDGGKTHVDGYETVMDAKVDGISVYAKDKATGEVKKFKSLGYLALQHDEFMEYCRVNHAFFSCIVWGGVDSMLRFSHEHVYPSQYE